MKNLLRSLGRTNRDDSRTLCAIQDHGVTPFLV
jgi:hypothetical protein